MNQYHYAPCHRCGKIQKKKRLKRMYYPESCGAAPKIWAFFCLSCWAEVLEFLDLEEE